MERIDQPLDEGHVIRKAQRAVQVQRARGDIVKDFRHDGLHRGHVLADGLPVLVLVGQPGGLEDQKPELPQFDPAIRDFLLNHLLVRQCLALGNARDNPLARHLEGAGRERQGPHGVVHTPAAQSNLGDDERIAAPAQHVFRRDTDIRPPHVTMRVARLAVDTVIAHDLDAGGIGRDDEHRHSTIGRSVGIGDRHDDVKGGIAGIRGEPFLAVDDPAIAVLNGCRLEAERVRAAMRLGDREAGHDLIRQQRLEKLLFLLRRAVMGQDLAIAGIWRLRAEDDRPEPGAAELLVHERELDLAVALAAKLRPEMATPQSPRLDLRLQRPHQADEFRIVNIPGAAEDVFKGLDLLSGEAVDPVDLGLELWISRETPHGMISCLIPAFLFVAKTEPHRTV